MSVGADDVRVLLSKFEGWTFEQADVSPPPEPMNVIRLRAPDGRVSWVAMCGAFGLGAERCPITAYELKAGHRLLTGIESAKRRAEREVVQRRQILPESPSPDDCPPFGMLRPPMTVEVDR